MVDNYVGWSAKTDTKILLTGTYPPPPSHQKVVPHFDIIILQNVRIPFHSSRIMLSFSRITAQNQK